MAAGFVHAAELSYQPKQCFMCERWNKPMAPFQIACNTYYVGPAGLSSILITSDAGHILIDGGLPQSAAVIDANIKKLGFETSDVRLIVSSHSHFDHVGGLAKLQQLSQAQIAVSPASAEALISGGPTEDDPQFAFGRRANSFPAAQDVLIIDDKQELRVGRLRITAHFTPGHTAGGTSWSWQSCESGRCFNMVYADSLSSVSAPEFRYTDAANRRVSVNTFMHSIDVVRNLPCDILLSPHPGYFDMQGKLARREQNLDLDVFVDSEACRRYADKATVQLEQRIAQEKNIN